MLPASLVLKKNCSSTAAIILYSTGLLACLLFHNSITLHGLCLYCSPKNPQKTTACKGGLRHGPSKFWNLCFFCFCVFLFFSRGFLDFAIINTELAGRPSCRTPWAPKSFLKVSQSFRGEGQRMKQGKNCFKKYRKVGPHGGGASIYIWPKRRYGVEAWSFKR